MTEQILKDRMNRRIGVIRTDTQGVQTIFDAMNRRKGTYDPRNNTTKDAMNRIVGKGNLLVTLL